MKLPALKPLHFGLLLAALDAVWTLQALQAAPTRAASNVALVGLIVWSFIHLPAGVLAGILLRPFGALDGGAEALPGWALAVMAALGVLQSLLLGWGAAAWWLRRKAA